MNTKFRQMQTIIAHDFGRMVLYRQEGASYHQLWSIRKRCLIAQLILVILLGVVPMPSYAQLTEDDIQEMRVKMNEYANAGKFEEAKSVNALFLEEYRRTGNGLFRAKYLMNLGVFELWAGNCEESVANLNEALPLYHPENDKKSLAKAYHNLVIAYSCLYDHASAFYYAQKELEAYTEMNDAYGIARATNLLAQVYEKLDNLDSTYALAHRNRNFSLANGFDDMVAESDMTLGSVLLLSNQPDSSTFYLDELIRIADTLPMNRLKATAYQYRGFALNTLGRHHAAADAYEQAIDLFRQQNWTEFQCFTQLYLADAYIGMGVYDRAQMWIDSAEYTMQGLPDSMYAVLKDWYEIKRNLADAMGDSIAGSRYYRQMLRYGDSIHSLRQDNLLQVLREGYAVTKKEDEIMAQEQLARNNESAAQLIFLTGLAIALGMIVMIYRRSTYLQQSRAAKQKLKADLAELQKKALSNLPFAGEGLILSQQLDKEKVQVYINAALNETDWKLLQELALNANASNKYLAEQISISHEGVRSSLKKMYRLFKIEDDVVNKKMALILKVSAVSVQE